MFDLSTSPTLRTDVLVDGQRVIGQREYPSELSRPIDFDGSCKTVQVFLSTPHAWSQASASMIVRPAFDAPPCDATQFPNDAWSVCLFRGRHREEPIGRVQQARLEVPKNQPATILLDSARREAPRWQT